MEISTGTTDRHRRVRKGSVKVITNGSVIFMMMTENHKLQGGRDSGVRDLREKLSGAMHSQPPNIDLPKAASESIKPVKKTAPSAQAPLPESKKILNPTSSKMKTLEKSYSSVDGLLQSLGLKKYLITFQAEEVDMTALMHMTDNDLKALGIPMGPRKKILLALESRA